MLKVLTVNLLNEAYLQQDRLDFFIKEVNRLDPDIIALQEVNLIKGIDKYLQQHLKNYHSESCSRPGHFHLREGLLFLSKYKINKSSRIVLDRQHRIAQVCEIKYDKKILLFVNVHMHWSIFSDKNRLRHIQKIINLECSPDFILGDFNALPRMKSIRYVRRYYKSAIGTDSMIYTYPSHLKRTGARARIRRLSIIILGLFSHTRLSGWTGMIDYIFVNKDFKVSSSEVVFKFPSGANNSVFVSDHLGVFAEIKPLQDTT